MGTDTITWLHLSDLHFNASRLQAWNQDIVLKKLLDDLREQIAESGAKPDFVLISGDIAFSGQPVEYKLAQDFFDDVLYVTNLSRERLFLVPGNHDVNREDISSGAKAITEAIANKKLKEDFRTFVGQVLRTDEDQALLFKRLQAYQGFVSDYLSDRRHLVYSSAQYFYVYELNLLGKRIAILCLNSAWLCYGGDEDRNRILLGEYQVRTALNHAEDVDLIVALLHHPFNWLHDLDREDIEALLTGQCDFILHGHLHHPGITQLVTPDSGAMIIAAGASYEKRQNTNAYNLVCLDLSEGKGKIILRRYSDERGGFWAKDVLSYHNVKDGEFSFVLPHRMRIFQNEITQPQVHIKNLSGWPEFQPDLDIKYLINVRAEFIEAQLYGMIKTLGSAKQGRHPIIGKFLGAANYLVQNDVGQLRELLRLDSDLDKVWAVLRSIEKELTVLSEEFLDYQSGSVLRKEEETEQICQWSDALLAEIGARTGEGWQGTSVLADKAIAGPNSHLVRLSFPNEDIWSLPFAVYQYVSLMNITQQVARLMSFVEFDDEVLPKLLPMLATDMLATHLAGPAYAFATVSLWFDSLHSPDQEHQGQEYTKLLLDLRFNYIVRTLEYSGDLYAPEKGLLKRIWQAKSSGNGRKDSRKGTKKEYVEYLGYMDELYRQVVLLRYGAAVDHTKRKLSARRLVYSYENEVVEENLTQIDLVDILNAAWYSRMLSNRPEELYSMKEFYRELFRKKVVEIG
jgi:predicted phosphodiesterase